MKTNPHPHAGEAPAAPTIERQLEGLSLFGQDLYFPPAGTEDAARADDARFAQPVLDTPTRKIRGMVRGNASIESQAAAVRVLPARLTIQARLLEIIETEGPQTCKDLEARADLHYGRSTVSARLVELKQAGSLVQVGRRDGCAILDLPSPATPSTPDPNG